MSKPKPASVDNLLLDELCGLVVELLARVSALEEENAALKEGSSPQRAEGSPEAEAVRHGEGDERDQGQDREEEDETEALPLFA